jgi:hypothetical protein
VESAQNELIAKIIPKCIQSQANEDEEQGNHKQSSIIVATSEGEGETITNEQTKNNKQQTTIKDCLLSRYKEHPISTSTTWRWLQRHGYCRNNREKSFVVDGHKQPDVVFYRNDFCTNYLSKKEPCTYSRWI